MVIKGPIINMLKVAFGANFRSDRLRDIPPSNKITATPTDIKAVVIPVI
jgi:hypothetical protein